MLEACGAAAPPHRRPRTSGGAALAREIEVLGKLSRILEMASCRAVCAERHPGCKGVLAKVIANYAGEHDVQVYGQLALAHLLGPGNTLEVVRLVWANVIVLRAFLWTTRTRPRSLTERRSWPWRRKPRSC